MIAQKRHEAIMEVLRRRGRLAIDRLQAELGVSRSTLRRDLLELEHLGDIVRRRGVVAHAEAIRGEPTFERRRAESVQQKQWIARRSAALVQVGASVYLDAGTTCLELGRELLRRSDLRLFTHSIRLVAAATDGMAPIVCIGGEYRRVSDALVGNLSATWLDQLRFDICFVGASGMDLHGVSTTEISETLVKQQILRRSARRVLVADSEKWNRPAAVRFAGWRNFTDFVTDADFPADVRRLLGREGLKIHVVTE